ncbi:MAG: TIGR03960 family B12-binding radical SAM protein [Myxococcales bacterium]|nr:TIGR03960 family B12-binding radical SAM protein [Myxococcales bacterium]
MQLFDHPYAAFLHQVEKPNRYTGAEHGTRKRDWSEVDAKVCLAFPEIYDIGMSHLGFRILYKILNDNPRTLAERCYAPWVDLEQKLLDHGQLLVSLESARPLCDFDVVGFSLQFELTYTNMLRMLDLGGIPLRSANRSDADPLIVVGGPVATHMEPVAPFVDAVVIGDGEEVTTELALLWVESKRRGLSRDERLQALAKLPGVYVPSLYATELQEETGFHVVSGPVSADLPFPVERRLVKSLADYPFPAEGPVGGPEAIFDRMSIEVARGCTEGCRFCQAGMIYRPVRERDPQEVIDTVLTALEKSGQDEVSLTALSTADVSCISPLIKQLVEKTAPERVSLGVASLRAYGLADDLLDDMRKVRASGLTFAPEAGTQRMRDVVNKNVTEAQLLETAERTFSKGFDKMKLYFMIGLPTEEDEDVEGIVQVGLNALSVGRRYARGRAKVTVSVSTHVPKPHTPFQWCAMDPLDEVARKQQLLKQAAKQDKQLGLRVHYSVASALEGVLARGDRSLADAIERAYLNGAHFDSWDSHLKMEVWQEAFEHFGVDTQKYLGTIPVTARLPWDHIDVGLEEGFLAREYRKALRSRLSPPCGKAVGMFVHHTNVQEAATDQRRLVCYDCGVACDMGKMRSERIGFLTKMGATEPGQRARLPMIEEARAEAKRRRQNPEAFRPERAGGPAERFRLRFSKTGPAALLGHLDMGRELARVLKRAGLRVSYSAGFNPKPELSYGPALSLGVPTLDEFIDIKLIDAPESEPMLARLNAAAGGGMRFSGVAKLGPNDPGLSRIITAGSYVIALARSALTQLGGLEGLRERINEFNACESRVVLRTIKGVGKKVDVRKLVKALSVGDERAFAALDQAGFVGDVLPILVTIEISNSGSAKTSEVVEALTGDAQFPHQAVRVAILAGDTSPLDLAAHKKQPRARALPADISAEA